jgi:hypothetical protein
MATLTIVKNCTDSNGMQIPLGTKVEYLGHVPGGMVKIRYGIDTKGKPREVTIHPAATAELG